MIGSGGASSSSGGSSSSASGPSSLNVQQQQQQQQQQQHHVSFRRAQSMREPPTHHQLGPKSSVVIDVAECDGSGSPSLMMHEVKQLQGLLVLLNRKAKITGLERKKNPFLF